MSLIRVTADLNYNRWIVSDFIEDPHQMYLQIGFTSLVNNGKRTEFHNLKFGFFLKDDTGKTVQQQSYPPAGMLYISSDQDFLEQIELNTIVDRKYQIHIWAEDAGVFYDHTVNLTIPKYTRPYTSWTWNPEQTEWQPPVEYPSDGNLYMWDEEKQLWYYVETSTVYPEFDNIIITTDNQNAT